MNQRIREIIDVLKEQRIVLSDGEFASEVGIGKSQLSEVITGKRKVSEKYIRKMRMRFPEINEDWLRNGEGEMLKNTSAVAENHSISIAGEGIKENEINVNTDKTIERLIAEMAAQRKLTERTLAEIAAQRQLTETALKQNSDLIALLGKGQNDKVS